MENLGSTGSGSLNVSITWKEGIVLAAAAVTKHLKQKSSFKNFFKPDIYFLTIAKLWSQISRCLKYSAGESCSFFCRIFCFISIWRREWAPEWAPHPPFAEVPQRESAPFKSPQEAFLLCHPHHGSQISSITDGSQFQHVNFEGRIHWNHNSCLMWLPNFQPRYQTDGNIITCKKEKENPGVLAEENPKVNALHWIEGGLKYCLLSIWNVLISFSCWHF